MMRLIYLIDRILFQRLNIILSTLLKKHETITDNLPVRNHTNKIKKGLFLK